MARKNEKEVTVSGESQNDERIATIEKKIEIVEETLSTMKKQMERILDWMEKQKSFSNLNETTEDEVASSLEHSRGQITDERHEDFGIRRQKEKELARGTTFLGDTMLQPTVYVTKGQLESLTKLLKANGKGTPTDLAKLDPKRKPSVESSHLNQLWLKGYVLKQQEGRKSVYILTEKGKALVLEKQSKKKDE